MEMITIDNDGPLLKKTNYWGMEHAKRGLFYLSVNAGALRLLVPRKCEFTLKDMLPALLPANSVEIEIEPDVYILSFEDGTDYPFRIELDKKQCDRQLQAGPVQFLVYTEKKLIMTMDAEIVE